MGTSVLQARPELAPAIVAFAVPELTYPPQKALVERRAEGVIKSFNEAIGAGFIQCDELFEVFENDVLLQQTQLNGFQPGQPVSFAVTLNKDSKPQAYDLQSNGFNAKGGCKGVGKGKGKDHDLLLMSIKGKSKGRDELTPLGDHVGTIMSFNPMNGFGFIECEEARKGYNCDVFFLQPSLGDMQIGDIVLFAAFLNSSGKPQAKGLQRGDSSSSKRQRTEVD